MTVSQEDAIERFDDLPDEVTDHLGEVISKFPKTLDTREDIAVLIAMVTVAIYDGMVADGWHKHEDVVYHDDIRGDVGGPGDPTGQERIDFENALSQDYTTIDFGDFTLRKGR